MTKISGRTACLFICATATLSSAQTLTTLAVFNGTTGISPNAVVQAIDGNFYGTTSAGGGSSLGTIFRIAPGNPLSTVSNFNGPNGAKPYAGLIQATNGRLYGTTNYGGAAGLGTVYTLSPAGPIILYSFNGTDGSVPYGSLVEGSDGNFYGTTSQGGTASLGTVFKVTPRGVVTTLHNFSGLDGANPHSALIQSLDGDFYGTTFGGGLFSAGTLFKIDALGSLKTIHTFSGLDGQGPNSALIQAGNTNFYGTTHEGGLGGAGIVFQLTPVGTLTTLQSFANPGFLDHGLVRVTNGDLYGVCDYCGGDGSIFRISATGGFDTVINFDGANGCYPNSTMIQGTDGNLYGSTLACVEGGGTLFSLNVGLRSFVETLPTTAKPGRGVRILGNYLAGSTSVSFGGTLAAFAVVSDAEIQASVPIGAITGTVVVTTPSRTLLSNAPFVVLP